MHIVNQILSALFNMTWEIGWGLALGFILSSLTRAFISTEAISARLGKNSVAALGLSAFFGAISSSCSYAAASMARTLVIKGSTWSNAVAFMVSSTNLVFEIFIVIVTLLGWSFFGGEVIGGIIFIILSALLIVWFFPKSVSHEAREQVRSNADATGDSKDSCCDHNHKSKSKTMTHDHAHHIISEHNELTIPFQQKLKQASGHFFMDVSMVGKDILIGIVVSAILMVLVPDAFWKGLFLTGNSALPQFVVLSWNAMIGILIAIFAFVCSVGNIVLANVLWRGGISFGGVIAFILSDLVTFPMLMVYRKYFGLKTMWYLLVILTFSIFITSLTLDYSFELLHWIPKTHVHALQMQRWQFEWNYTTWLNLFFIPASIFYFFAGRKAMK